MALEKPKDSLYKAPQAEIKDGSSEKKKHVRNQQFLGIVIGLLLCFIFLNSPPGSYCMNVGSDWMQEHLSPVLHWILEALLA